MNKEKDQSLITSSKRHRLSREDTWNLDAIYANVADFYTAAEQLEKRLKIFGRFKNTLKREANALADCLHFSDEIEYELEKIGSYALLKHSENLTASEGQELLARYHNLATRYQEASSFIIPEIIAIPDERMACFMRSPQIKTHRIVVNKIRRHKPHVLSKKEEQLLAAHSKISGSAGTIFRQLSDADFDFGTIRDKDKRITVTHGNWGELLEHPSRKIRKRAFDKMFDKYAEFENTLGATYNAQVQEDVVNARIRKHNSCVDAALFQDNIPLTVLDNLIATVRGAIHLNHRYLALHRKQTGIEKQHFYDTYVPIVKSIKWRMSYAEAVETIIDSLAPLGNDYCLTLQKGLLDERWVDRYECRGKQSGAFSAGGYGVPPFILMNYQHNSIQGVYTLAHEGGHSMHTLLSARHQAFCNYDYSIFVAEVASTFNEQLLTDHLLKIACTNNDIPMQAYIVDREINQIRSTLIRQTMFAEFEKTTHEIVENQEALTVERLKHEYGKLLEFYLGSDMVIDEKLKMEWARIPHFYAPFYVYKYATGLAAATTLAQRVQGGNKTNTSKYLSFLKSGGKDYPLDVLRKAGANLRTSTPIKTTLDRMKQLLDKLEALLDPGTHA